MKEYPERDYGYYLQQYEHCSEYMLRERGKKYSYIGWFIIIASFLLISYGGWVTLILGVVLLLKKHKYAKIIAQRKYFAKKAECLKEQPETEKQQIENTTKIYNEATITPSSSAKKSQRRTLANMPSLYFEELSSIKSIDKMFPLVILRVDTTGLNKGKDKIIKISADKYGENFELLETFSTFVNPGKPISEETTKRNKITNAMVSDSPTFTQVSAQFQQFIDGCNICSYYLYFHISFLYKAGIDFSDKVKYYDVCEIARDKIPEGKIDDYQLQTVCKYYDVLYLGQNCDTIKNLFEEILTKYNKLHK